MESNLNDNRQTGDPVAGHPLFGSPEAPRPQADAGNLAETVKNVSQIIYYLSLSIAGVLAFVEYFKSKSRERALAEHNTYNELDNRFFEYQRLALEYYDLDMLDVPNNDPSVGFDKKRKQEMVAYSILFSLFERAYLLFSLGDDNFRTRQWSGWKHFLNDFIRREGIRTAWKVSKVTYDTNFQAFMDQKIAEICTTLPAKTVSPPLPVPAAPPAPVAVAATPTAAVTAPAAAVPTNPAL